MERFVKKCENLKFAQGKEIQFGTGSGSFHCTELEVVKNNRSFITQSPVYGSFYFEVTVITPNVRIGICTADFKDTAPVGCGKSYGYGSIKGYKYHENIRNYYGDTFTTDDVISVLKKKRTLKFFKNGKDLGVAYNNIPSVNLFPCISFYGEKAAARVNFGPQFSYFSKAMKYERIEDFI